jgi:2-keto-4-pentenoate hydratase/2-oxohepta-3-ene-1,7-dioic acid hydratase in catechol pathway
MLLFARAWQRFDREWMMNSIKFDQSLVLPSKVVCVGRNYLEHIHELGNEVPSEPVIFMKPNSAICSEIVIPRDDEVHYEGEITFLLEAGKLAGVGFGLDLTKRVLQSKLKAKGQPWERAKAFDQSAVFSDFVRLNGDTDQIRLELFINGELTQQGGCHLMINKPEDILKELASFLTLEDGDLLMTGTPKGVGPLVLGDHFVGKVYDGEHLLVERYWIVS